MVRAFNTVLHPGSCTGASLAVGVATIVLIVLLERTRLGSLGLVVAVVVTSGWRPAGWDGATSRR